MVVGTRRKKSTRIVESDSEHEPEVTKFKKQKDQRVWELDLIAEPSSTPSTGGVGLSCSLPPQPAASLGLVENFCSFLYGGSVVSSKQLVVHCKKLGELEMWFKEFPVRLKTSKGSILLVSGPVGSGKTACIKFLCQAHSIQVVDGYQGVEPVGSSEHKTRLFQTSVGPYPTLQLVVAEGEEEEDGAKSTRVKPGYPSKLLNSFKVVIFDDLPNAETASYLEQIRLAVTQSALQVVLLVTDPCGYRSFNDDPALRKISLAPNTCHVNFNPIAPSFLTKLLKSFGLSRKFDLSLDCGDARASILDCLIRNLVEDSKVDGSTRDSSVGLFHSLGRILYARKGKGYIDPSTICEADRPLFHAYLHANYLNHINALDSVQFISDTFSWIDSIGWRAQSDHFWASSYLSLPEASIFYFVNQLDGSGNPPSHDTKSRFRSLGAPRKINQRLENSTKLWL